MQARSNISTFSCNRVERFQTIIRGKRVDQARSEAARGQPAAMSAACGGIQNEKTSFNPLPVKAGKETRRNFEYL